MPRPKIKLRSVLIIIFAIILLGVVSFSDAAEVSSELQPSLTQAELKANQAISDAEVAKTSAELQLAEWKLQQLSKLKGRGHATWQECATQQTKVDSLRAGSKAALAHRDFLLEISAVQKQDAQSNNDTESIPLFVPGSTRLVGWVDAEQANSDLLQRQLKNLRRELASTESIDVDVLQQKAIAAKNRVQTTNTKHHLQERVTANAALVSAEEQLAVAHKSLANVLQRRIAVVENILSKRTEKTEGRTDEGLLATVGTPFISAQRNDNLARLTNEATSLELAADQPVKLLQQLADMQGDRVKSLTKLSVHQAASNDELVQAKSQLADLQVAIDSQESISTISRRLATSVKSVDSGSALTEKPFHFESDEAAILADPSIVRHIVDLHRRQASLRAAKESAASKISFLQQRFSLLQEIPEQHRAPRELKLAQQKLRLAEGRIAMIDQSLNFLSREAIRVVEQFKAQRTSNYEFVQAEGNLFVPRAKLVKTEAFVATLGFLGSEQATHCNYIESPAIFRFASTLSIEPEAAATLQTDTVVAGEIGSRLGSKSAIFKTLAKTRSIQLATDGITYPSDLFNYVPSDLWQSYPGYRGYGYVPLTYRNSTVSRGRSLGYSSTSLKSGPFDRSNFYRGVNPPGAVTKFYSRIPRYRDFYSFGIRRYDGPAGTNFRRGTRAYTPFYLPGSPTNFRY